MAELFRNTILGSLLDESDTLRDHLHYVQLPQVHTLYEPKSVITDVYFVEDGIIWLTSNNIEVRMIGSEGLVGASAILRPDAVTPYRAFTQIPATAYRISVTDLLQAMEALPKLRAGCLWYVDMAMKQTGQLAVCNASHVLSERLARWLLMVRDRIKDDTISVTQEFLARLLGVGRTAISAALQVFQSNGLIRQLHGRIIILDNDGLMTVACECYQIIIRNQNQIIGTFA